jgi:hypothetical protein
VFSVQVDADRARAEGEEMKAKALALLLGIVFAPIASAQTGSDLFKLCSCGAQERTACDLYVSGFLHGLQVSQDLPGKICLPSEPLSGAQAVNVYLEFVSDVASVAALKKGLAMEQNPFFAAEQSHSLFGVFAMKFPCAAK